MEAVLKLKIKDVEVELSRDEVVELKALLNNLFPVKDPFDGYREIIKEKEYIPYYPPVMPMRPYYWHYDYATAPGIDTTPVITWCGANT